MARAILKYDEKELTIGEDITSFGRTAQNTVSFPDNSNISRNHAEIAFKNGKFVLNDLGSSNGTTVNGQKIEGETDQNTGDFITLGNSVVVEFGLDEETYENAEQAIEAESVEEAKTADEAGKSSKLPVILGVTGLVCGLAVVFAVAAVYVGFSGGTDSKCDATARIVRPLNGEILSQETDIKVDVTNGACVSVVHVMLNGKSIADLNIEPYEAQIDPKNYPELADGGLYALQLVLEDAQGNKIPQTREIALQFETKEVATPTPKTGPSETPTPTVTQQGKQITLIDVQKMTAAVVGKFTGGNFKYNISNPEFLKEVQKKTGEYSSEGYFGRATNYKDFINQAFVRDKGLDASLPYLLAMSRSKFNPEKQADGEGLWRMSSDFAAANTYNVVCGTGNLSDPTQDCAAKVTALYMEDLVIKTFDFDIVFAVASFGKTPQEANIWKAGLPADRSDFWKVITDSAQREQVVRFFAAAIVAENPNKFGLKKDRPISELYPTIGK